MPTSVTDPDARVASLWLGVLQQLSGRAAHEIKGALNGVAVNLEVVRGRAARPGVEASAVASFADSAAAQLEAVSALTDALLALVRPVAEDAGVAQILTRLRTLLEPVARSRGGSLTLEHPADGLAARTAAPGEVTRLVLAAVLGAAVDGDAAVTCRIEVNDEVTVRVRRDPRGAPSLHPEIATTAAEAGIRLEMTSQETTIAFPSR
jgi:hypothetical protein